MQYAYIYIHITRTILNDIKVSSAYLLTEYPETINFKALQYSTIQISVLSVICWQSSQFQTFTVKDKDNYFAAHSIAYLSDNSFSFDFAMLRTSQR